MTSAANDGELMAINHGRNLLLNVAPKRMGVGDSGYEYVEQNFKPIRFTESLSVVHRVLFGASPDNRFLNLRAKELLTYVHETEFASYIYRLDPRVTYWPPTTEPSLLHSKKVIITQVSGTPRRVAVGGTFNASNTTGTAEKNFIFDLVETGDAFTATLQPYGRKAAAAITETFSSISAAPTISAPDTAIRLSVATVGTTQTNRISTEIGDLLVVEAYDAAGYLLLEAGSSDNIMPFTALPRLASVADTLVARWVINMQADPLPAITTIMPTLELLGEPVFIDLFGVSDVEPYTTFKNLWFDHPLPNYRLAGLTLAFIYRAEEQRLQNG